MKNRYGAYEGKKLLLLHYTEFALRDFCGRGVAMGNESNGTGLRGVMDDFHEGAQNQAKSIKGVLLLEAPPQYECDGVNRIS